MKALALILLQAHSYTAIEVKDGENKALQFQEAIDWECPKTGEVNIRKELRPTLAPIVAAIRYAENGGPGREYGILHKRVKPTYRSQAGWCAATVQKNWDRWQKTDKRLDFITFLGTKYAPIGADNDPNKLNYHWIKNVKHFHTKIVTGRITKK